MAEKLVQIAHRARNLKGHGLDEGISTRLLVYGIIICWFHPLSLWHPLDKIKKLNLEGELTPQETLSALKLMKNGKSPGMDGFTSAERVS
jgi:hypothetical protein